MWFVLDFYLLDKVVLDLISTKIIDSVDSKVYIVRYFYVKPQCEDGVVSVVH